MKILNMRDIHGTLPVNAVYVGRPRSGGYPLHFGNPVDLDYEARRGFVCDMFASLMRIPESEIPGLYGPRRISWMRKNVVLLHGRDLACWCAPKRCHAETLATLAEASSNKPVYRVIVAGGRDYNDYDELCAELDVRLSEVTSTHTIVILTGMAKGADLLGARYGRERCYHVSEFPAFWDLQGKAAGYRRNEEMRKYADVAICFWDGQSKGTREMIDGCHAGKIPYSVIMY